MAAWLSCCHVSRSILALELSSLCCLSGVATIASIAGGWSCLAKECVETCKYRRSHGMHKPGCKGSCSGSTSYRLARLLAPQTSSCSPVV